MASDRFAAFFLAKLYSSIGSPGAVLFFAILSCSCFARGSVWAACACQPAVSHCAAAAYASSVLLFARALR